MKIHIFRSLSKSLWNIMQTFNLTKRNNLWKKYQARDQNSTDSSVCTHIIDTHTHYVWSTMAFLSGRRRPPSANRAICYNILWLVYILFNDEFNFPMKCKINRKHIACQTIKLTSIYDERMITQKQQFYTLFSS